MHSPDSALEQYNGLTAHTRGLPAEAYFEPRRYERELEQIWHRHWIYVCRSSEIGRRAVVPHVRAGRPEAAAAAGRRRPGSGFPQYLPAPRLGPVPRERGRDAVRGHRLSLPCLGLQPAGRSAADLLEGQSRGVRAARSSLYRVQVHEWRGFLFVRSPRSAAIRRRSSICLPAGWTHGRSATGGGPRAAKDHPLQLEDILGELQRVPALSRRASAALAAGPDLRPRPPRGARRPASGDERRRRRPEVQGRPAPRRRAAGR